MCGIAGIVKFDPNEQAEEDRLVRMRDSIAPYSRFVRAEEEKLKADPQMQTLEDVICLVFLENYFSDFARENDEPKLIGIIKRTWIKMSARGREMALSSIKFADDDLALIKTALSQGPLPADPKAS